MPWMAEYYIRAVPAAHNFYTNCLYICIATFIATFHLWRLSVPSIRKVAVSTWCKWICFDVEVNGTMLILQLLFIIASNDRHEMYAVVVINFIYAAYMWWYIVVFLCVIKLAMMFSYSWKCKHFQGNAVLLRICNLEFVWTNWCRNTSAHITCANFSRRWNVAYGTIVAVVLVMILRCYLFPAASS